MTQQSPFSSTVKSRRLSLFGHVAQMNELADANRILFVQPSDNRTRPPGRPCCTSIRNVCNDLSSFGLDLPEAREEAQNRLSDEC